MRKISKTGCRGFSLIEVMFGIAILSVVSVAALSAFINSTLLTESSRNLVTAACDAQYVLEQIKAQDFSSIPSYIANYSSTQFNNLPGETVTFPNPSYTSTLDTITVRIDWSERAARSYSLTTRYAQ